MPFNLKNAGIVKKTDAKRTSILLRSRKNLMRKNVQKRNDNTKRFEVVNPLPIKKTNSLVARKIYTNSPTYLPKQ